MKASSLVIFGVILCATNAFAAPNARQSIDLLTNFLKAETNSTHPARAIRQYKCLVKVLETVSNATGLESLWAASAPSFAASIDRWQKCGVFSSPIGALCHVQESATAYILTTDYLSEAFKRDPVFVLRVLPKYVTQCVRPSGAANVRSDDDVGAIYANPVVQELWCRFVVTYTVVRDTEYAQLWKEYEQAIVQKFHDIANCRHVTEVAQCLRTEVGKTLELFEEFIGKLHSMNVEAVEKLRELYERQCVDEALIDTADLDFAL